MTVFRKAVSSGNNVGMSNYDLSHVILNRQCYTIDVGRCFMREVGHRVCLICLRNSVCYAVTVFFR